MRPTISQYAEALEELSKEAAPLEVSQIVERFLHFLKRRGESKKGQAILKRLEQRENTRTGTVEVQVMTTHAVSLQAKKTLEERAKKLFSGKKVELQYREVPALIGGARLSTDEVLYDATLSTELGALKNILLKG